MTPVFHDHECWGVLVPVGRRVRPVELPQRGWIGRDPDAAIQVLGSGIRPRHACLEARGDELWVVPGPGAETVIDGHRVGMAGERLRQGVALRVGEMSVVPVRVRQRRRRYWVRMEGLTSSSPAMWREMHLLSLAASRPWPVLLQGESGTGKELAARLVHTASPRCAGPFVAVNCAALPSGVLSAELFGHVRGAFTGAVEARSGAFARADGGTLLLDELGELSPAGQAALLRVLENGEVQVVGGETRRVDVRLVAATNVDLAEEAARGRFRPDLLHRLTVTPVRLPPLRERLGDPVLLAEDLLSVELSRRVWPVLDRHRWPGNIRELRNVVRRVRVHYPNGSPPPSAFSRAIRPACSPLLPEPSPPESRMIAVAEAVRASESTAAAWRRTGLPHSTFFRYLAQVRAAEATGAVI